MPMICRQNSERISVADAKRLILDALPLELGAARFFGKPGPDGEPIWDFDSVVQVPAAEAHAPYLDSDFLALCKGLGFEPHMMFSPAIGGYSANPKQDDSYMLTHAQFVKLAECYSLTVEIEPVSPAPAQEATTPAPGVAASDGPAPLRTVINSTKARRDTLTPVIEQAQKQCTDPSDTAAVWAALLVLAEKKTAPLIGATEEGLQYLKGGTAEIFKRKSLGQRLAR